jgi:hypothetical protein
MSTDESAPGGLDWGVSRTCESGVCVAVVRNVESILIGNSSQPSALVSTFTTDEWRYQARSFRRNRLIWRKYSVIMWSSWAFTQLSSRVEVRIPRVHRIFTIWQPSATCFSNVP